MYAPQMEIPFLQLCQGLDMGPNSRRWLPPYLGGSFLLQAVRVAHRAETLMVFRSHEKLED